MEEASPVKFAVVDINEILKTLPHRYPMLLIDKVLNIRADYSGIGIKNVTFNEPPFLGHFPDRPIIQTASSAIWETCHAFAVELPWDQCCGMPLAFPFFSTTTATFSRTVRRLAGYCRMSTAGWKHPALTRQSPHRT